MIEIVLLAVETGVLYEVKIMPCVESVRLPLCDPVLAIKSFVGYLLNSVWEIFAKKKKCQAKVRFVKIGPMEAIRYLRA